MWQRRACGLSLTTRPTAEQPIHTIRGELRAEAVEGKERWLGPPVLWRVDFIFQLVFISECFQVGLGSGTNIFSFAFPSAATLSDFEIITTSDIGGSIRIPSFVGGIFGMKPTPSEEIDTSSNLLWNFQKWFLSTGIFLLSAIFKVRCWESGRCADMLKTCHFFWRYNLPFEIKIAKTKSRAWWKFFSILCCKLSFHCISNEKSISRFSYEAQAYGIFQILVGPNASKLNLDEPVVRKKLRLFYAEGLQDCPVTQSLSYEMRHVNFYLR